MPSKSPRALSCELLSKIIIFVTRHNINYQGSESVSVVNCFQKLLSSWHDTTPDENFTPASWLWIAFKNYYLRDTTQQSNYINGSNARCELLSKIIIFVTRHNPIDIVYPSSPLWIAFKNYYLRDTTQRSWKVLWLVGSCELLSKIIIFVTRHNIVMQFDYVFSVVNCFQKLLSSWHDTTLD